MDFFGQNRGAQADGAIRPALPRFVYWLLLGATAGLMFCIIPIPGFEFRLSWQLAAIWLAGFAFTAYLSGWIIRLFWLNCLAVTAWQLPPNYSAYIALLSVAIFLAAAEGFKLIQPRIIFIAMRIAALLLIGWIVLQEAGVARTWFAPRNAGPFNPDVGGCFLAMCLPAFMAGWWWLVLPVILYGLMVTKTTTAFIAAVACVIAFWFARWRVQRRNNLRGTLPTWLQTIVALLVVLVLAAAAWSWMHHIRPDQKFIGNDRFIAWQYAARHIAVEPLGRGLGSWETAFPLLASGVPALNIPIQQDGKPASVVFMQAHNEYVQAAFEMGIQSLVLIVLFLLMTALLIWRGLIFPPIAAGAAAVAVCCCGFHIMHIEPAAIIGMAWLGLLRQ